MGLYALQSENFGVVLGGGRGGGVLCAGSELEGPSGSQPRALPQTHPTHGCSTHNRSTHQRAPHAAKTGKMGAWMPRGR